MRKSILLASFAALCATVSAASADGFGYDKPYGSKTIVKEIVQPVTYYGYGYGYRHGYHPYHYGHYGHYYRPYYYYGGYYRHGYRHWY